LGVFECAGLFEVAVPELFAEEEVGFAEFLADLVVGDAIADAALQKTQLRHLL
jgi:hypothetical protein